MRINPYIFILFVALCFTVSSHAQKKHKRNKGTSKREIRKRQQKAFEQDKSTNAFNPIQPRGAKQNDARDDLLWHNETANTVYPGAGNISLTTPSRYAYKPGLEFSSTLPLNYWIPNVAIKKRWANATWHIASRHGLYSATPGFHWAQKRSFESIIDSSAHIPFVLSISNELILSRYISQDMRCSRDQPFVILSAGLGFDYGYAFGNSGLKEINEHLLTNRSPALTGAGGTAFAKLRADWQINGQLMLGGGIKYFYGNFSGNHAFEQATELQTFILSNLSLSVGYIFSFGHYNTPASTAIYPLIDIKWYFGKRQSRQKGLWGTKMF